MDISCASHTGVNLVYVTANGEVHPMFYESRDAEWQRIFFGGLLTTCGLTCFSPPGRDCNEELGLHARCTAIPARGFSDASGWDGDEYRIELSGTVEEAVQFGDKLPLSRRIIAGIGRKSLVPPRYRPLRRASRCACRKQSIVGNKFDTFSSSRGALQFMS